MKESKPIEVKVKLKIKDVKITLSLDEVKELAEILGKIVGKETEYYPYIPYYEPYRRTWEYPHWDWGTITTAPSTTWTSGNAETSSNTSVYSVSLKS